MRRQLHILPRTFALFLFAFCLTAVLIGCSDDHDPGENAANQTGADTGDDEDASDAGDDDATDTNGADASDTGTDTSDTNGTDVSDDGGDTTDTGVDADIDDGPVCGNGIVEEGQNCDDGVIEENCDTYHDGGDGYCVPPDECSDGFILDDDGDCIEEEFTEDIDIHVDNFCNLDVDPPEVDVAEGQTASFVYHNQSVDYAVDIWGFYGGGYIELETGDTWDDPFEHCTGANTPTTETMDISVHGLGVGDANCPGQVFEIHCQ